MFKGRINLTKEQRETVKDTFGNECAHCSNTEKLQIHHQDGNPNNNNLDNLILLCVKCHAEGMHPYKEEEILKWAR